MSEMAGNPPPPPPPPPPLPKKNVYDLPAELLLSVIQYLKINDYVTFALAIYPVLRNHGLVPLLSADIYHRITFPRPSPEGRIATRWSLPLELTEEIMSYLEPTDRIAFLFSHRELSLVYLPELSKVTKARLRKSRDK